MDVDGSEVSGELGAKRRLLMEGGGEDGEEVRGKDEENALALASDIPPVHPAEDNQDLVKDRTKRPNKARANSPSLESAGSFEGPVRSQ
jgi:hypothetical protein